jgi:PDZ-binding kinase
MERSPNRSGEIRSPWAIKKISKIRKDNELIEKRLEYEAGILKGLSHQNIIGYRSHGHPAGTAYLAMEKAPKSLGDLIEERVGELTPIGTTVPFDAKHMTKVALDMAKALQYLHDEKRIIHGDLKSANILIFGDFEIAKLCDFGVSRKIKEDGSLEGRYVGTEIWNPMEVILEKRGIFINCI